MGGKKKGEAKAAAGGNDEGDDDSTQKLYSQYVKKCKEMELKPHETIKKMYEEDWVENNKHFTKVSVARSSSCLMQMHIWNELGWQGVRAFIEPCIQMKYKHILSIRLWKGKCQDEGARHIAAYVGKQTNCTILELLDCQVTSLGCEFLQRCCFPLELNSQLGSNLTILKLDHNPIGAKGMNMLAEGLSKNPIFQQLSFTYCNITPEGGEAIKRILIFSKSQLLEFALSGNPLGVEGII